MGAVAAAGAEERFAYADRLLKSLGAPGAPPGRRS